MWRRVPVATQPIPSWPVGRWKRGRRRPGADYGSCRPTASTTRIRIYWLGARPQLYGDARLLFVDGKRGASIEVHPDLTQFGPQIAAAGRNDRLFRDTVVYLTCLHETGHGIGLEHTADCADIMYSFQYGGDVLEYFNRYRRTLKERPDIPAHSGISEADGTRAASLGVASM